MDSKKKFSIYSDHIFGDLERPENAALWLRKTTSGVYHGARKTPLNPKPGEKVQLMVSTDYQHVYDRVNLVYSTDDWQTKKLLTFAKSELIWDTALWSYVQHWTVTLPAMGDGVMLRYKIFGEIEGSGTIVFSDSQSDIEEGATNYSILYEKRTIPDWAKTAIVYQIFVDRFNPGEGKTWRQTSDLRKPYGGTLQGITEKLDWIKTMGFNAIWLTPIFESPSHHGYDTTNYFSINPRFGCLEDFQNLLEKAHHLGLKVILDFVANHCSNQHPFFIDTLAHPNSDYLDWFVWKDWPEYDCFFNVKRMPKMNLKYGSPARTHLLEAAQYWLEVGVDGYRLDYAIGPEQDFWVDFRRTCQRIKNEMWTFGEVVAPAHVQASFANGINGTLDFLLCDAFRHTFALRDWKMSKFVGFLNAHFAYFPEDFSYPSFIDNHDMNRFYFTARENKLALKLALLLLYNLPQPPIIYYGTETLLLQKKSIHAAGAKGFDETRWPMNWGNEKIEDLPNFLFRLSEIRNAYPKLSQTPWHIHWVDDQKEILVLKKDENDFAFLIINISGKAFMLEIPLQENRVFVDCFSKNEYRTDDQNRLSLKIPPQSGKILLRC